MEITVSNPTAFDAFADSYDDSFTGSSLGRLLRPRVWARFAEHFSAGQHLLELTCGTGEDAVWLARRGLYVTATDGSARMVEITAAKASAAGVAGQVTAAQLSLQALIRGERGGLPSAGDPTFDGVYSNFGGLNTIADWPALAETLARLVKPGGKVILTPMGPLCPWEIVWHLLHGQPGVALRRFHGPATARIGQATIPIWYPAARQLRRAFGPWFGHLQTESLGLWLPPSYLEHLAQRWPGLFGRLSRFEESTARLTGGWGDHYIIIFERKRNV
jgi:ubiquinone/menaquinone biosynthesis C-methylase UbiE